ncbi:MAG: DNA polymerase III subunit alpha, partial [Gammaproteobacteria bacterium]
MSGPGFVHLHLHSEYSLSDGLIRIPQLVEAAARAGMPAVALTDLANLFAVVRFYKAALAAGIKPIVGAELWLEPEQEEAAPARLVLLCQDRGGYLRLARLITRCYTEGRRWGLPALRRAWLEEEGTEGLIALSAGPAGEVGQALLAGREDRALALAREWAARFPDRYYLSVQRTGRPGEELCLEGSLDLAERLDLPVVATNDVRFLAREDFEAHEARVCIHEGRTLDDPQRPRLYSEEQYLRSPEEMARLFADLPEALANSVAIARRCNLELSLGRPRLPAFPVPEGRSVEEHLEQEAREGLARRLAADPEAAARRADYEERLAQELQVIVSMGFAGYFLIVADFIRWAKGHGVPVGPGRGSGAGSLVAYCLEITDLDPIRYDLLFERFLNPERVSMPDFDVDFCMEGRDRVIDYVVERYGRERVSQIITFGTMAARAVVRDVGRVLGHPYGFVDKIAKLIPFELGMTLDKALEQEEELRRRYEEEEEVRELIDLARKLEGLARNAGKHAGGVVIAPTALTDFTALYCEPDSPVAVTQLDKDDVEAIGLVKFDFLGLRTLTIIDRAVRMVNERRPPGTSPLDIARIPLDDEATFRLLKDCATTAVFQLESQGMKDLIRRLQPDRFEDIVALVALFRPGPLQSGMVDDFIHRKHGRIAVAYPHPALEPILAPTYGVILYQEQVMQIAQVLAGYSLGGADLLRRAMGKKKPEEMAKQREVFLRGARERGVDPALAGHIFDLMEKFAGYGFNKSHSAAYALVAYQTAWLKAHHPAAFMAATLTADMQHTDKVVALIEECRRLGLRVLPPDINRCRTEFALEDEGTILYGLGAIKGVGA